MQKEAIHLSGHWAGQGCCRQTGKEGSGEEELPSECCPGRVSSVKEGVPSTGHSLDCEHLECGSTGRGALAGEQAPWAASQVLVSQVPQGRQSQREQPTPPGRPPTILDKYSVGKGALHPRGCQAGHMSVQG